VVLSSEKSMGGLLLCCSIESESLSRFAWPFLLVECPRPTRTHFKWFHSKSETTSSGKESTYCMTFQNGISPL
jgi:hypothetical protein